MTGVIYSTKLLRCSLLLHKAIIFLFTSRSCRQLLSHEIHPSGLRICGLGSQSVEKLCFNAGLILKGKSFLIGLVAAAKPSGIRVKHMLGISRGALHIGTNAWKKPNIVGTLMGSRCSRRLNVNIYEFFVNRMTTGDEEQSSSGSKKVIQTLIFSIPLFGAGNRTTVYLDWKGMMAVGSHEVLL